MKILAIETTGPLCSIALLKDDGILIEKKNDKKLKHLESLMPMIEELLREEGVKIGDLDYFAVSEGPGSFTGIRIGIATAKALAQATGKKIIPVPTLEAFVYETKLFDNTKVEISEKQLLDNNKNDGTNMQNYKESDTIICPIFDARREQVYGGAYGWEEDKVVRKILGAAYNLSEYLEKLEDINVKEINVDENFDFGNAIENGSLVAFEGRSFFFAGDGVDKYQSEIEKWAKNKEIEV
ncbi:MAG: tRNA (adenosine(37)-N6)-threonylcarbamoyltransferase complex dimerization subunit type 1 TsaB, partial [Anaerovoracaceae bacterium]